MRIILKICLLMTTSGNGILAQPVSAIDSVLEQYFKPGMPGAAVLIARDGSILYQKGFGVADIQTGAPITTHTLFNIGSISKTFVAYGILKLAEEGKLSLQHDLYTYFPDFVSAPVARKVKLIHLLTHSSGLPDSRNIREQREFYLTAKDEENWEPIKATRDLQFEPGTRYRYSNPAFNGLALVIERVTGKKWQDYVANRIFRPAGMSGSTITDGPHPQSGVAHGYVLSGDKQYEELDYGEEPTFAAAGNGGVWSSVHELWKYEQAIQQNKFLSPGGTSLSRKVYPLEGWKDSSASRLGISWFLVQDMGEEMIGHTGSQGGFISDYCWYPRQKIFYVLLCNSPQPIREIRRRIMECLFQDPSGASK